jgi:sensor domain CHASE-containing protein
MIQLVVRIMSRKATSASGNNLYLRLYLLPIIVFILLLVLLSVLLFNQRRVELEGVDDLLQLQSGLLAEKISSKLNTFELTLRMLE